MIDFNKIFNDAISTEQDRFKPEQLEKMAQSTKLDLSKRYEKPKPILSFVENNGELIDVLTLQNISMIMAPPKGKKTYFAKMVVASILGCNDFAMRGDLFGREMLYIDTEQAPYHVQLLGYQLKEMARGMVSKVNVHICRGKDQDELTELTKYLINKENKYSFVVIDGIVDYVKSMNDEEECKSIVIKLMKWSLEYNCHIIVVLHTGKSGDNALGHLGSFLYRKCETVFHLKKFNDYETEVNPAMTRNKPFTPWQFSIDKGLPVRGIMPTGYYDNGLQQEISIEINPNARIESENDLPF